MSKCPKCGSEYFEVREDDTCLSCGWQRKTVFHHITESPETLAEKLVYIIVCEEDTSIRGWTSSFTDVHETKEQAFSATVEKLKEAQE